MFKKIIALVTSFFIVEQVAVANQNDGDEILLTTTKGEIIIKLLLLFKILKNFFLRKIKIKFDKRKD